MCAHAHVYVCAGMYVCGFFLFYKLHLVLDSISVNKTGPIVSETI